MFGEVRCCFCLRLPSLGRRRPAGATAARCPVCHGPLVRTVDGTYRDDGPSPAAGGFRAIYAVAAVAVVAVGGLAWSIAATKAAPPRRVEAMVVRLPEPPPMPPPPIEKPAPPSRVEQVALQKTIVRTKSPAKPVATAPAKPAPAVVAAAPEPPPAAPAVLSNIDMADTQPDSLTSIPELPPITPAVAGSRDRSAWRDLERAVREHKDHFLDHVVGERPELADLPFLKGSACRLEAGRARDLDESSKAVRRMLSAAGVTVRSRRLTSARSEAVSPNHDHYDFHGHYELAQRVRSELLKDPPLVRPNGLPGVEQVLTGEEPAVRLGLVQSLRSPSDAAVAAHVLARRAVFDASVEVRQTAIDELRALRPADYLPILLDGLRHPWPPANKYAAQTLVALRAESVVPDLVSGLAAADPADPFEVERDGKTVLAVRELVRLNHHGSCLLCHAPSFDPSDPVRGPVPRPDLPLPREQYYGGSRTRDGLFVRADVTYLRQDFSAILPVENPGPWPKEQRFDFVVRTRRLTGDEITAWAGREPVDEPSPSRQARLFALRQLTGLDGGTTAASWQEALAKSGRK